MVLTMFRSEGSASNGDLNSMNDISVSESAVPHVCLACDTSLCCSTKKRNFGHAPQSFLDIVICVCTTGCRTLCCVCLDVRLLVLDAEAFDSGSKILI